MLFPLWANPTNQPIDEVGGPNYLTPEGVMAWSNNLALGRLPVPADCSVRKLIVQFGSGPGAGRWWIIEYLVNGVAVESTQVKIEGTAKEGKWSGELKLKEGDTLQVRMTRGGAAGGTPPGLGIESTVIYTWVETVGNIFFVGGGGNGNLKTGETSYNPPFGINSAGWQAVEGDTRIVVPGNFTLKALAVDLSGIAGTGKSYTLSGRVNRSEDVLAAKVEGAATTALTKGSVPVKPGETLETKCVPAGTPSGRFVKYCFAVEAEKPGEIFVAGMDAGADSTTATQYSYPDTWKLAWTGAESSGRLPRPAGLTFERFYVQIGTAPGEGKSRTYVPRMGGVNQALKAKIEGVAKSGNDTTHAFITDGGRIALGSEPAGTPAVDEGGVHWGFIAIVLQPAEFAASVVGTGSPVAGLRGTASFAAAAGGAGNAEGELRNVISLAAQVQGQGAAAGQLGSVASLISALGGVGEVGPTLGTIAALNAVVFGGSSLLAALGTVSALGVGLVGASVLSGNLNLPANLAAGVVGDGAAVGSMQALVVALSASLGGTVLVNAELFVVSVGAPLDAVLSGLGALQGQLETGRRNVGRGVGRLDRAGAGGITQPRTGRRSDVSTQPYRLPA